jgi:hypothetical protein
MAKLFLVILWFVLARLCVELFPAKAKVLDIKVNL